MAIRPQFQKLLDSCQEMQFSHLRPLVDRMFENADIALLDFAEKAENNMAQSLFFDAMNEVRKKRKPIEQIFYEELKRSFAEFPAKPENPQEQPESDNGLGSLSLVDTDEMETAVASQNAAAKLVSRIMEQIFALKQRLTVVNGGDTIEEGEIPGGPAWLSAAYQRAVEQLELENKVRLVFIALFDKYVLSQVDPMFDEFNKRLIQADILPNLRYEVRKQPGSVEIIRKDVEAEENLFPEEQNDTREAITDQTPSELGDELFGRICDLMAGRRGHARPGPGYAGGVTPIHGGGNAHYGVAGSGAQPGYAAAGVPGGGVAGGGVAGGSGPTLVGQISSLQSRIQSGMTAMSSSEFIENIEVDNNLIERLQHTLAEEREKIFGGIDRNQLPDEDNDVIELVGMMFEYMLREENLPNVVKALLSRLHTPLLKVAVVDKTFFTRADHPARKLLDDMTSAGIRWVDENDAERGIFPKMKEIVDRLLVEYREDAGIFDELLEDFSKAVGELNQRARLVEKRTMEAANGQEKLQAARHHAQEQVRKLAQGKAVTPAARDFLQRIWADKLTFILLRQADGAESAAWQDAVRLAQRVIDSTLPPSAEGRRPLAGEELAELQSELRSQSQSLQQPDKEKLLGALFESQQQLLKGEVPPPAEVAVPETAVAEPAAEEPEESTAALSPEQEAMLQKLASVQFGTWFEFSRPGEERRRLKLSWRSTVTEKYMFVDQMGVKATVVSMHELADAMIDGSVRIVGKEEKKPFVERALSAIHRMLDHSMAETAQA